MMQCEFKTFECEITRQIYLNWNNGVEILTFEDF